MSGYITAYSRIRNGVAFLNGTQYACPVAETPQTFLKALYKALGMDYPKFHKMDLLSKLGVIGVELLWKDREHAYKPEEVAIILSNRAASLVTDRKHETTIRDVADYFPSPAIFVYTLPNIVIGEIAIRHGFQGENSFFVSDRFNAEELVSQVQASQDFGQTACCLTGWVEVDENTCESLIFLIEKQKRGVALPFEAATLNTLYSHK